MSIQGFGQDFPARQAPFIDPSTGALTRDGAYLLLAVWSRTGKGTGIIPIVSAPLIATGTTIADALGLVNDWNLVGPVAANSGVLIPPLKPGNDIQVFNNGANALKVYPPTTLIQIDALGNGSPFSLAPGKLRAFQCWTTTQFYSFGS